MTYHVRYIPIRNARNQYSTEDDYTLELATNEVVVELIGQPRYEHGTIVGVTALTHKI